MRARIASVCLGLWLFVSGALWPHSGAQLLNAWFGGGLIVVLALLGTALPGARLINVGLGVWVAGSGFLLRSWGEATVVNHLLVGVAVAVLSFFPADDPGAWKRAPDSSVPVEEG